MPTRQLIRNDAVRSPDSPDDTFSSSAIALAHTAPGVSDQQVFTNAVISQLRQISGGARWYTPPAVTLSSAYATLTTLTQQVAAIQQAPHAIGAPTAGDYSAGQVPFTAATLISDAIQGLDTSLAGAYSATATAQAAAVAAQTSANTGIANAATAQSAANAAQTSANTGIANAAAAQTSANAAQGTANAPGLRPLGAPSIGTWSSGLASLANSTLIVDAVQAVNLSLSGVNTATGTAQGTANTALANAATAQSAANAAQTSANTALTNVAAAQATANVPGQQAIGSPATGNYSLGYAGLTTTTHLVDALQAIDNGLKVVQTLANNDQTTANAALANAATAQSAANAAQATANAPGQGPLGAPTSGTWAGSVSLTNATKIADAIQALNVHDTTYQVAGAAVSATTLAASGATTLAALTATTGAFSGAVSAQSINLAGVTGELQFGGNTVYESDGASTYLSPSNDVSGSVFVYAGGVEQIGILNSGITRFAGSVRISASGQLQFTGRSTLQSTADGYAMFQNNAGTGFTGLRFGGATNAFPMLKVSGTTLAARLADDTGDAPLTAANLTLSGTISATTGSNSNIGSLRTGLGSLTQVAYGSYNCAAQVGMYFPSTTTLGFATAGTNAVTIDASQNTTFAGNVTIPNNKSYLFADGSGFTKNNTGQVIVNTIGGTAALMLGSSNAAVYCQSSGSTLGFSTGGVPALLLDGSQNATFTNWVSARVPTASKTAAYTVLAGESNKTFDNSGAAGTIVFTLPAASPGLVYGFTVKSAFAITLTPTGTDAIIGQGMPGTAGGSYTTATAIGTYIALECTTAGFWVATGSSLTNWYTDSNGALINSGTGGVAGNSIRFGPATGAGIVIWKNGGQLQFTAADASGNATLAAQSYATTNPTAGASNFTTAVGGAGMAFYYDSNSFVAANTWCTLYQARLPLATKTAASYTVLTGDSNRSFNNIGAGAQVVFTLPVVPAQANASYPVGLTYRFTNFTTFGIQLKANTGDVIQLPGSASSAAGTQTTTTIGGSVTLTYSPTGGYWYVSGAMCGTWTSDLNTVAGQAGSFDSSGNATFPGNITATTGSVFLSAGTANAGFVQMGPTNSAGVRMFRNGGGIVQFGLADQSGNANLLATRFTTANPDAFALTSLSATTYGFGFPTTTTAAITTNNVVALSISSSQNATFAGNVTLPAAGILGWTGLAQLANSTPNGTNDVLLVTGRGAFGGIQFVSGGAYLTSQTGVPGRTASYYAGGGPAPHYCDSIVANGANFVQNTGGTVYIGAPSNSLTFYTNSALALTLSSSQTATLAGQLRCIAGTASAPSVRVGTATAQVNTLAVNTLTSAHAYAVTINGTSYSYTATGTDTQQSILTALNTAIGTTVVTGAVSGTGVSALLTLTSVTAGAAVTYTAVDALLTLAQTTANVGYGGLYSQVTGGLSLVSNAVNALAFDTAQNATFAANVTVPATGLFALSGQATITQSTYLSAPTIHFNDLVNGRLAAIRSWTNIVSNVIGTAILTLKDAATASIQTSGLNPMGWQCGYVWTANGNASIPAYSFTNYQNTGMYAPSAGVLKFTTGGTDALTLDASQNATFANGIVVNGTSVVASISASGNVNVAGAFYNANSGNTGMRFPTTTSLALRTNAVDALTIDASQVATFAGNVVLPAAGSRSWTGRSVLTSPSDGALQVQNSTASGLGQYIALGTDGGASTGVRIARAGASTISFVDGTGVFSVSAQAVRFIAQLGSAASPSYGSYNNTGYGLYYPSTSQVAICSNSVAALTWDASQNSTFAGQVRLPAASLTAPALVLGSTTTVAQVNTIAVNTLTAAHVYTVTVNGTAYTYTATGGDTQQSVLTALNTAIGTSVVTGAVTGTGASALLTLTAVTAGVPVTYGAVDSLLTLARTVANQTPGGLYSSVSGGVNLAVNGVNALSIDSSQVTTIYANTPLNSEGKFTFSSIYSGSVYPNYVQAALTLGTSNARGGITLVSNGTLNGTAQMSIRTWDNANYASVMGYNIYSQAGSIGIVNAVAGNTIGFIDGASGALVGGPVFVSKGVCRIGGDNSIAPAPVGLMYGGRPVASKTANYTVVTNDSGVTYDNNGASASTTYTLPAIATVGVGATYSFFVRAAFTMVVAPNAADTIVSVSPIAGKAAGATVTLAATAGTTMTIRAASGNAWEVIMALGTLS